MASIVHIKAIIPKGGLSKMKMSLIEKEMTALVVGETDIHEKMIENVTRHFRRKIKYTRKTGVGPRIGYFSVIRSGYRRLVWTDQGTSRRPAAVTPMFQAKTTPRSLSGSPGIPARYVRLIRKPGGGIIWAKGVRPRYFFKEIVARREAPFVRKAAIAIDTALRKAIGP